MSALVRRRMAPTILLGLVLLAAAILRFWRLGASALVPDEAYYWLWSRHLAPGYYDHPAGVAFLIRASALVAGESEAGLRWLNALLGVGADVLHHAVEHAVLLKWKRGKLQAHPLGGMN